MIGPSRVAEGLTLMWPRAYILQDHQFEGFRILQRFLYEFSVDAVFDVGANVGQSAIFLRQKVGYRGLIFSFEPHFKSFNKLSELSQDDENWYVFGFGLSDKEGQLDFYETERSEFNSFNKPIDTGNSVIEKLSRPKTTTKVKVLTLNTVQRQLRERFGFSRPFLKIDTQGHDAAVFRGAGPDFDFVGIQSEISFKKLYEDSLSFSESIDLYRSKGFDCTAIFPNTHGHFPELYEMDIIMHKQGVERLAKFDGKLGQVLVLDSPRAVLSRIRRNFRGWLR